MILAKGNARQKANGYLFLTMSTEGITVLIAQKNSLAQVKRCEFFELTSVEFGLLTYGFGKFFCLFCLFRNSRRKSVYLQQI